MHEGLGNCASAWNAPAPVAPWTLTVHHQWNSEGGTVSKCRSQPRPPRTSRLTKRRFAENASHMQHTLPLPALILLLTATPLFSAEPGPLPRPWKHEDIGAVEV